VRITDITVYAGEPRRRRRRIAWPRRRRPVAGALGPVVSESGGEFTSLSYSPDGATVAVGHADGYVALVPAEPGDSRPVVRLIGLPGSGWAAVYGEHRYRLHGDPAGRFWWSAGLCRFEPGELDGYGVEQL
jgi:hypothetical protein